MAHEWTKIRVPKIVWALLLAFSSYCLGAFQTVGDELYTLALYCGRTCYYPYPWTVPLAPYPAFELDWGILLLSVFGMVISFHKVLVEK